jgi:alkylated DNA repair dioxygenase AlkB
VFSSSFFSFVFICIYQSALPSPSTYTPGFLSPTDADDLLAWCEALTFIEVPIRGKHLKRAPKSEFYFGERVIYRWGQEKQAYNNGQQAPPILYCLREKLGEEPNHALVIHYKGKKHFAPPHKDKQDGVEVNGAKDIVAGTTIFSISVGKERTSQLIKDEVVVWEQKLAHGSLFKLHPDTNKHFKHAVPRENVGGDRYSIIFRHIKQLVSSCFLSFSFVRSFMCVLCRRRRSLKSRTTLRSFPVFFSLLYILYQSVPIELLDPNSKLNYYPQACDFNDRVLKFVLETAIHDPTYKCSKQVHQTKQAGAISFGKQFAYKKEFWAETSLPPVLAELALIAERTTGEKFDIALLKVYSPGESLALHQDVDGSNMTVACFTFASDSTQLCALEFYPVNHPYTKIAAHFTPAVNSLWFMDGNTNSMYSPRVLPAEQPCAEGLRVSVTFCQSHQQPSVSFFFFFFVRSFVRSCLFFAG